METETQAQTQPSGYYSPNEVIGSVLWHPTEPFVVSCTTDNGVFHVLDTRASFPNVFGTEKSDLYAHCYRDDYTVLLGYGDGGISVLDLRRPAIVSSFRDPCMAAIGEIRYDRNTGSFVCFGQPRCVTLTQ